MSVPLSLANLKIYAEDQIAAHRYPDDRHTFRPANCVSCRVVPMIVTIKHHTGSSKQDFKGQIVTKCTICGNEEIFLSFTGSHRKPKSEERPTCRCGNKSFLVAECERIEGAGGIPGFFDEGVIVGQCAACGQNHTFVYTD
jgi:hypothetical protein